MSETTPPSSSGDFERSLAAAKAGSREEFGRLLESCRGYLLVIANGEVDARLRTKVAPSDLVQETLLKAHGHFEQFRGVTSEELLGWLRKILTNNLKFAARQFRGTGKRQIACERSLESGDSKFGPFELSDPMPTPGAASQAREDAGRLKDAVKRMPADYREVLLLRSWDRLAFAEVGKRLNRTTDASRKLWYRAVLWLRGELLVDECSNHDSDIELAAT